MRRKLRIPARLLLLALPLLAGAAGAQDFKIRAKVDLVVVPVTVKTSDDKLVTGLTMRDFILLEDGQRQTLTNFTIDPVPLSAAVVVHTGLSPATFSKIQKTLTALAGAFSEFDEVGVYRYNKFVTKLLDASNNPELIETAMKTIDDLKADAPRQQTSGVWLGPLTIPGGPFSIPGPSINGAPVILNPPQIGVMATTPAKASNVLHDAIFAAASDLGKSAPSRRRMVLVISDGETGGNEHTFEETTQSLLAKGVQVYAVGLDQPFPYKAVSPLGEYAKATGGDAYFVGSVQDIETAYFSITEEARNQYVLGYISSNTVAGQGPVFREIAVQVNGRNLKALHRKGYYQYPENGP
jgi:VWFA-related protein